MKATEIDDAFPLALSGSGDGVREWLEAHLRPAWYAGGAFAAKEVDGPILVGGLDQACEEEARRLADRALAHPPAAPSADVRGALREVVAVAQECPPDRDCTTCGDDGCTGMPSDDALLAAFASALAGGRT